MVQGISIIIVLLLSFSNVTITSNYCSLSDTSNADGLGYILLINHIPMLYAPEKYLGDHLASYGLTFSVFLRISNTGQLNVNTTIVRQVCIVLIIALTSMMALILQ